MYQNEVVRLEKQKNPLWADELSQLPSHVYTCSTIPTILTPHETSSHQTAPEERNNAPTIVSLLLAM